MFNFTKIKNAIFTPQFSFRNVVLSLLLGILVSYLTLATIYGFSDANYVISEIFQGDFASTKSTAKLTDKIVILGFAGLSVLIASKAGMLNIGVSGQMMMSAFIAYITVRKLGGQNVWINLVVGFVVAVVVSALIASLSGILKAKFKVNEVITTIMANWIILYILKFFSQNKDFSFFNSGAQSQIQLDYFQGTKDGAWSPMNVFDESPWILTAIGLSLFVVSCIVLWFVLTKTVFGFKIKSIGSSLDASKYAGYNVKTIQILSMALSGVFAGMAGFVMYFITNDIISIGQIPINEGFAGIAVALVAMNNPLGVIASAFVFGIFDGPTNGIILGGLPSSIVQIFSGIITYFVAISTMWMYLRPIQKFKEWQVRKTTLSDEVEKKIIKKEVK